MFRGISRTLMQSTQTLRSFGTMKPLGLTFQSLDNNNKKKSLNVPHNREVLDLYHQILPILSMPRELVPLAWSGEYPLQWQY